MMFSFKCRDCRQTFTSASRYKHFCPSCLKEHKRQATMLYFSIHPDKHNPKTACPQCGQPMCTKSKLCQACQGREMYGEKHPSWKGGRYEARGYIFIHKPDYPKANSAGYVLEHILVWETYHNKLIPKGWEVHHYNGIRNDNRPSNLFAKSKRQHRLIIPELHKRIQELEALLNKQHQLI